MSPQGVMSDSKKHELLRWYAADFRCRGFLETGTFMGETVAAVADMVERTVSIEKDPRLHAVQEARFKNRPDIEIVLGDSALLLGQILAEMPHPCLIWLDAHGSGWSEAGPDDERYSPLLVELGAVLALDRADDVILADDMRSMGRLAGWPARPVIRSMVAQRRPGCTCVIRHDILRCHNGNYEPWEEPVTHAAASV